MSRILRPLVSSAISACADRRSCRARLHVEGERGVSERHAERLPDDLGRRSRPELAQPPPGDASGAAAKIGGFLQ